jgi:hypothetical protein
MAVIDIGSLSEQNANMPKPKPPVEGEILKLWRFAADAYRRGLRGGWNHEEALRHASDIVRICSPGINNISPSDVAEKAVSWTLEHHAEWLERPPKDRPPP